MRTYTWKDAEGRFCVSLSRVNSAPFWAADTPGEAEEFRRFVEEAYRLGRKSMASDLRRLLDERHGAPT